MAASLDFPEYQDVKAHLIKAATIFFESDQSVLEELPISQKKLKEFNRSLQLTKVKLPNWFSNNAKFNSILIPSELESGEENWHDVDWWSAAFVLLECWHERLWEDDFGPINSYSSKLKNWDKRAWEIPIVNQIFLFLNAWNHKLQGGILEQIPNLPSKITLTFDLDAVQKSTWHSIKYSSFLSFNIVRSFFYGNLNLFLESIKAHARYLRDFRNSNLCNEFLGYLEQSKDSSNIRINVFVELEKKNTRINIYDPTYTLENEFTTLFPYLKKSKIEFGLHSSAVTYQNHELIREQKIKLESIIGQKINSNRTHWLRFSWHNSWDILDTNGFIYDETLMFNDRLGFRNSASLKWNPWSEKESKTLNILANPSILMDSHLYLYGRYDDKKRTEVIRHFFEVNSIYGGNASIVWHPHTLSLAYGWNAGFNEVLKNLGNLQK
jgi:hypothetical protein